MAIKKVQRHPKMFLNSFSYIKTRDKMYANERQEILLVLQLSLVFSFVGIQKLDL